MCIIRDDAEAGVGGVLLHDAAERHLRGRCHGVRFVEDNEFVVAEGLKVSRLRWGGKDLFCTLKGRNPSALQADAQADFEMVLRGGGRRRRTCKRLYLFPHHVNPSVIASIELQNHLAHVFIAIDPPGERKDCRCLSCARWAIEQKMWQSLR